MNLPKRIAVALIAFAVIAAGGGWLAYRVVRAHFSPDIPTIDQLQNIQLGAPLRVYTADGKLIGQFGAKRRQLLTYDQIPKQLRQAFLAAEDSSFFSHGAVDWLDLARAAWVLISTGQKRQGGSTIAMQLARDLFLSPKKTYTRKIKEILTAQRLERTLTKKQILTLYLNRVYLGSRAYGVGAAAYTYYGKDVEHLTLSEMATLAGLPQAPSRDNPLNSPKYARARRNYVLRRMHDLGWISPAAYREAMAQPVVAHLHQPKMQVDAPYVAEMVREEMVNRYGNAVYRSGDVVTTTINSKRQREAARALRAGLIAYTERHGYNGPTGRFPAPLIAELVANPNNPDVLDALSAYRVIGGLRPAVVRSTSANHIALQTVDGPVTLTSADFSWAHIDPVQDLKPGDIVRIEKTAGGPWQLAQVPKAESAFVALNPQTGAIEALVGGFDFYANSYNRAIQAQRQVGSGFKPYYYSAALAEGYSPASTFLDAPVVIPGQGPLEDTWRPQNDNDSFGGPMRLREALAQSVNLVSIRLLRAIGVDYARQFITSRFGIPVSRIPDNLTAALGTAQLTPLEQARGYAVFANGGFLVNPYFIQRIQDQNGNTLYQAQPLTACPRCTDDPAPPPPTSVATPASTGTPASIVSSATPVSLAPLSQRPRPAPPDPPTSAVAPDSPVLPAGVSTTVAQINSETGIPLVAGVAGHAPRTISPDTDYLIDSMLHSVITNGTGQAAKQLGRQDLAGKTGSTNNQTDAWFNGFNPSLVAVTWVGFDDPKTLGFDEYGARAALPIWIDFMRQALNGVPDETQPRPPGIVNVLIDPKTGKQVAAGAPGAIHEVAEKNHLPPLEKSPIGRPNNPANVLY